MKFCKDCKRCSWERYPNQEQKAYFCAFPMMPYDVVTGEAYRPTCKENRTTGACGLSSRYWEPKDVSQSSEDGHAT